MQAPLALVTLLGVVRLRVRPLVESAGRPSLPANAALLLLGALTAALFLLVLLLVDGWRMPPAAAGVVVTVMPVAAIVTAAFADRVGSTVVRAASGVILVAGLAALGVLPGSNWGWTVLPQVLVGAGLGLALSALTERALHGRSPQAVHGGWTIAARHAGVVVGLLLLTPVFTSALDRNEDRALRAGAAAVLDSRIPPLEAQVAQDVLPSSRADREVPDVRRRSSTARTSRSIGVSRSASSRARPRRHGRVLAPVPARGVPRARRARPDRNLAPRGGV